MSSEIEVVDEVESRDHESALSSAAGNSSGGVGANGIREESMRDDVYTAAAYGDLEKLQRLVECEGCSVSEPDGLGYYALQWAALNNRTAAAQYIIEVAVQLSLWFFNVFFFAFSGDGFAQYVVEPCVIGESLIGFIWCDY